MIRASRKRGIKKQMHLCCGPFWWLCERVGAIQMALPNAACLRLPGNHWTPPSGDYLLRITPGSCQGNSKWNNNKNIHILCWPFDGHGKSPVRYHMHCPMEEVQGFNRSHWTPPPASIVANSSNWSCICCVYVLFHGQLVEKEHQMTSRPHLTMGVWHIILIRRSGRIWWTF